MIAWGWRGEKAWRKELPSDRSFQVIDLFTILTVVMVSHGHNGPNLLNCTH